jgi:hypothetical protein
LDAVKPVASGTGSAGRSGITKTSQAPDGAVDALLRVVKGSTHWTDSATVNVAGAAEGVSDALIGCIGVDIASNAGETGGRIGIGASRAGRDAVGGTCLRSTVGQVVSIIAVRTAVKGTARRAVSWTLNTGRSVVVVAHSYVTGLADGWVGDEGVVAARRSRVAETIAVEGEVAGHAEGTGGRRCANRAVWTTVVGDAAAID